MTEPQVDGARVRLRPVEDEDHDALFEMWRDPASVWMAAFGPPDPDDRAAFEARMARIRAAPECTYLVVEYDGRVVGTAGGYPMDGEPQVSYGIDRAWWGRGLASRALALLLERLPERPQFARAASDNAGSRRVLEKAGFRAVGRLVTYANARGAEIEETLYRLD